MKGRTNKTREYIRRLIKLFDPNDRTTDRLRKKFIKDYIWSLARLYSVPFYDYQSVMRQRWKNPSTRKKYLRAARSRVTHGKYMRRKRKHKMKSKSR